MKIKKGDIVIDIYNYKRKILGVCGEIYFLSKQIGGHIHSKIDLLSIYDKTISKQELLENYEKYNRNML